MLSTAPFNGNLRITYFFVGITAVLSYPISLVLDKLLGDEISNVFTRQGLMQLIQLNVMDPEHAKESGFAFKSTNARLSQLNFRFGGC